MTFDDFDLPTWLKSAVVAKGWSAPTPVQALTIPAALEGKDILGGAPTGTGKSGAFLLPLLTALESQKSPLGQIRALILEPTRELAQQVCAVAGDLLSSSAGELKAGCIIGGAGREAQREQLCAVTVATPGRLLEFIRKQWLNPADIEIVVIDEADRMLDMGFRDDVLSVVSLCKSRRQTMLFSATLEGFGVRDFAENVLHNPSEFMIGGTGEDDKLPEGLSLRAYYAASDSQKVKILTHLLTTSPGRSIVFVKTRDRLRMLDSTLRRARFSCSSIQGEDSQSERQAAIARFNDDRTQILIATDVASRGLDLPAVTHVYNFDLPTDAAVFTHRAGRTGRAGAKGVVVSLVQAEEQLTLLKIERYTSREIERRQIKNLCAAFPPLNRTTTGSEKKRGRAAAGGGFDKRNPADEEKKHIKIRHRDKKNKGKPDFAAKRAKKAARLAINAPVTEPVEE